MVLGAEDIQRLLMDLQQSHIAGTKHTYRRFKRSNPSASFVAAMGVQGLQFFG
jgi:hypothetical protein